MRTKLISAIVLLSKVLCAQSTCEVWQWTGTDSANKILAKTQQFDPQGHLIYEKNTGFVYLPIYGPEFTAINYQYKDTLLITTILVNPELDSFCYQYSYDSAGRLVHTISSRKDHILKDTVQSGMFTISRVSVDSTDGKWRFLYESRITYDRWGRKILEEDNSPKFPWRPDGVWKYDEKGRVSSYYYYSFGKLHWSESYSYFDRGYSLIFTWYDENEKVVKPGRKSLPYQRKKTMMVYQDKRGNIVEERNLDYKGKQIDRKTSSYNAAGKIAGEVYYDAEDSVVVTHVYIYK